MIFRSTLYYRLAALTILASLAGCTAASHSVPTPSPEPLVFIQAGDPQMGMTDVGIEVDRERFAGLARRATQSGAEFVVVCGDLVNSGAPAEQKALAAALHEFTVPVFVVPGNHDVSDEASVKAWRRLHGPDYYTRTFGPHTLICINSTLMREVPKAAEGMAAYEQRWTWLERALADSRTKRGRTFLVMHHPPFVEAENEPDAYQNWTAPARARLLRLVRSSGVRCILTGHLHRTVVIEPADRAFTTYTVSGTARVDDNRGPGFNLVRVDQQDIKVEFVPLVPSPTVSSSSR